MISFAIVGVFRGHHLHAQMHTGFVTDRLHRACAIYTALGSSRGGKCVAAFQDQMPTLEKLNESPLSVSRAFLLQLHSLSPDPPFRRGTLGQAWRCWGSKGSGLRASLIKDQFQRAKDFSSLIKQQRGQSQSLSTFDQTLSHHSLRCLKMGHINILETMPLQGSFSHPC